MSASLVPVKASPTSAFSSYERKSGHFFIAERCFSTRDIRKIHDQVIKDVSEFYDFDNILLKLTVFAKTVFDNFEQFEEFDIRTHEKRRTDRERKEKEKWPLSKRFESCYKMLGEGSLAEVYQASFEDDNGKVIPCAVKIAKLAFHRARNYVLPQKDVIKIPARRLNILKASDSPSSAIERVYANQQFSFNEILLALHSGRCLCSRTNIIDGVRAPRTPSYTYLQSCNKSLLNEMNVLMQLRKSEVAREFIPEVYGIGKIGKKFFLNMQVFPQKDIYSQFLQFYKSYLNLSFSRIINILRSLLSTICAFEQEGIAHLDIKPSNLYLVGDRVVFGDFGTARPLKAGEELPKHGLCQTLFYLHILRILRLKCTNSIELWSIGVIIIELYSGMPLFWRGLEWEMDAVEKGLCALNAIYNLKGEFKHPNLYQSPRLRDFYIEDVNQFGHKTYKLKKVEVPNLGTIKEIMLQAAQRRGDLPEQVETLAVFIDSCLVTYNPPTLQTAKKTLEQLKF